ncbi:MAG: hypothetical protein HY048_00230 [Acidobacteria bacterium]|nr:hypothetical protein [Acidobacteriota bacterium]
MGVYVMTMAGAVLALAALLVVVLLGLTPIVDARRQRALRRTLIDVCQVFEAHAVDYWGDFGTLLGFHREKDIIRSDKDVDLGILQSEKARVMALKDVFASRGYDLTDRGGRARKLIRIIDRRTRYYADVYQYVAEGDLLRSLLVSPQEDIPARLVARRIREPFMGTTLLVPEDVPAVLRHRYGPSFGTPKRGEKGATRPYSPLRSLVEDLQDNVLGIWSWLRAATRGLEWRQSR